MFTKAYLIPVTKDWAFRSRSSQEELKSNHPNVSRISVDSRDKTQPDSAGRQMVKVTLYGSSQEVVEACFQEGKKKILDSFEYDRKKQERNRNRRKRVQDQRVKKAQQAMYEKFQGPRDEKVYRKDNALTAKLKIAMNKNKNKQSSFPKTPKTTATSFNKKKNPFGALMEESEDEEDIERQKSQAKRNVERQKMKQKNTQPVVTPAPKAKAPVQPVLTGWAKLASKPAAPKPQQEPQQPQVAKHLEYDDDYYSDEEEEIHHLEEIANGGWDMNPNEW